MRECTHGARMNPNRYMGSAPDAHSYLIDNIWILERPQSIFLERTPHSSAGVRPVQNPGASILFLPGEIADALDWHARLVDPSGLNDDAHGRLQIRTILANARVSVDSTTLYCIRQPQPVCDLICAGQWGELLVLAGSYLSVRATSHHGRKAKHNRWDIALTDYPDNDWAVSHIELARLPGKLSEAVLAHRVQEPLTQDM